MESEGWELNFNARITKDWDLFAGIAFQDTIDHSRAEDYPIREFNNVPENGYSLFTRYKFSEGRLNGFFVTGGATYKGERWTNWTNRPDLAWRVPGEWRFVTSLGYQWRAGDGDYSAILNIDNIANTDSINKSRYWDANPDSLRQIRFELRVKY